MESFNREGTVFPARWHWLDGVSCLLITHESVRRECWWRECVDMEGCWGESLLLPLLLSRCGVVLLLLFLSWPGARRRAARWAVNPCDSWFDYLRPQSSFSLLTTKAYAPLTSSPLCSTYLPPLNQLERFNMTLVLSAMWPVPRTKSLGATWRLLYWCSIVGSAKFTQLAWPRDLPRNYEDSWEQTLKRAVPLREIFQLSLLYSTLLSYYEVLLCFLTIKHQCLWIPL